MKEIITYRLTATGVWGYEFYHPEQTLIGSVRSVVAPSAVVPKFERTKRKNILSIH